MVYLFEKSFSYNASFYLLQDFNTTQIFLKRRPNNASRVIAPVCLEDDYNDITYNYTYLYDMEIGFDFHSFL